MQNVSLFLWILAKIHQAYKHTFHAYVRTLLVITQCIIIIVVNVSTIKLHISKNRQVKIGRSTLETVKGVLHSTNYAYTLII